MTYNHEMAKKTEQTPNHSNIIRKNHTGAILEVKKYCYFKMG